MLRVENSSESSNRSEPQDTVVPLVRDSRLIQHTQEQEGVK